MSVSHINYNHLYYFWHVHREGSVVDAVEVLYLTPQTVIGQIRALEERLQGKLFKCKGHSLEPSELGELVYRYADKMFTSSQKMLDTVNYRKEFNLLFDTGVVDALSRRLVSSVLDAAVVEDKQIHLRRFGLTHEVLLEQLSQRKLDMIISGCPIDSTQQEGLFSMKIGGCGVGFWYINPLPERPFPACPEERRLFTPGCRSMLGHKLLNWLDSQGLDVKVSGEFDDTALVRAFGAMHNAIFVVPSLYANDFYNDGSIVEIGRIENAMKEYHTIFAGRMTQHPVVQRTCNTDYSALFTPASKQTFVLRRPNFGLQMDTKKPAKAGFFTRLITTSD